MAITIWKLLTNIENRTLSEMLGLGHSTVEGIVRETCHKIVRETCHKIGTQLLLQYVSIPWGKKLNAVIERFETCLGFPLAAGAIDGTHTYNTS